MTVERVVTGPKLKQGRPVCSVCGLRWGNSRGVRVFRYSLKRTLNIDGVWRGVTIASLALCDACIGELAGPKRKYVRRSLELIPAI